MLNREVRKINRIRAKINGTSERPRLTVFRSNKHLYCQLIDDSKGVTVASASDKEMKVHVTSKNAAELGKILAKKASEKKISAAVFDRRGYKYHGIIKAVAEGARSGGIQI